MSAFTIEDEQYSLPPLSKSTTRGPVQLERPTSIRDIRAVQAQGLSRSSRRLKIDETVARVAAVISTYYY